MTSFLKKFRSVFALSLIFMTSFAAAPAVTSLETYANHVEASYRESVALAGALKDAVQQFLANPNDTTLAVAQTAWIAAHESYARTEVFRFYDGPIDRADGPEGFLNAWPLDESFIEPSRNSLQTGLIRDVSTYPLLSKKLLRDLNERDGEKNISTGYHAVEFMLWGEDTNLNGPGQRKAQDFATRVSIINERRRQYLTLVTEMIIEDLEPLALEWAPGSKTNYRAGFTDPQNATASLQSALTGLYMMAATELSQERMNVAYEVQSQEDEHNCFSDTTHLALLNNYIGLSQSLRTLNILPLLTPDLHTKILDLDQKIMTGFQNFPAPFDRAIFDEASREKMLELIHELEDIAVLLQQAGSEFGLEIK